MIVTSTTEIVPFVPSWREGEPNPPTFSLRAGSVIERGQMEAELSGQYRAGRVFGFELRAAILSGIGALLADDPDQDALIGLLSAEGEGEPLSDSDARLLTDARVLGRHGAPAEGGGGAVCGYRQRPRGIKTRELQLSCQSSLQRVACTEPRRSQRDERSGARTSPLSAPRATGTVAGGRGRAERGGKQQGH